MDTVGEFRIVPHRGRRPRDARTRRASPGLLLVQPDLGLHAPESDVMNVDLSSSSGLMLIFGNRLLLLQPVEVTLPRRNDLGLAGSRLAKRLHLTACPQ